MAAAQPRPRLQFITPLAPVGIHATIRARCPPLELLRRQWTFTITGWTSFVHPKLGQPSQWDSSWYCARWYALELAWDGSGGVTECARKAAEGVAGWSRLNNAQLCRGSWPHIAIGCAGVRCCPLPQLSAAPSLNHNTSRSAESLRSHEAPFTLDAADGAIPSTQQRRQKKLRRKDGGAARLGIVKKRKKLNKNVPRKC